MMNRRQFVHAAAAGVVTLARGSTLLAADYDLIVKGGRVIDPSLRINAVRDVAMTGGRIALVEANIEVGSAEVIDATANWSSPDSSTSIHTMPKTKRAHRWVWPAGSPGGSTPDQRARIRLTGRWPLRRRRHNRAACSSTSGAPASCPMATLWT